MGAVHVYALHVPYGAPWFPSLEWSVVKTANVCVSDVRVLCEHSAAWMSVEALAALQPRYVGQAPLVLDEHGSRVARTPTMVKGAEARMAPRTVGKCMFFFPSEGGGGLVFSFFLSFFFRLEDEE